MSQNNGSAIAPFHVEPRCSAITVLERGHQGFFFKRSSKGIYLEFYSEIDAVLLCGST